MCEQAQEQRKEIEALKAAAKEVLRVYMPRGADLYGVDDHLIELGRLVGYEG